MADGILETRDFDRYLSLSEKAAHAEAIAANDAFVRAMGRAIKRKRETAVAGTFVDHSPTYARLIRGQAAISVCGSPAAMCFDIGAAAGGAATLK